MVQFECPRHSNPCVSLMLGEFYSPIFSLPLSGVVRIGLSRKQEGNVLLEPAAPMFNVRKSHFSGRHQSYPNIREIHKSVKSNNPWDPEIHETLKSRCQVLGSDIFPGSYIFREVKFYREVTRKSTLTGSQIYREAKFTGKSNLSGSQLFQEVKFSGKSLFLGPESHISRGVTFSRKSHALTWGTKPQMMNGRVTTDRQTQ